MSIENPRPRHGLRAIVRAACSVVLVVGLAACGNSNAVSSAPDTSCLNASDPGVAVANQANARMTIVNDAAALDAQISCTNQVVPLGSEGLSLGGSRPLAAPTAFSLLLKAEVLPPTLVGIAAHSNGVQDDATAGGSYSGAAQAPPYVRFTVQIDGTGNPDTFRWSVDGGSTYVQSALAITTGVQSLADGVTVQFGAASGHALGEQWLIDAGTLQATSIAIASDVAAVGYAMAGAPYLGAVQVYRLKQNTVQLKSEALFRDMDVNAVALSSSAVYAVGAHEPVSSAAAVVQRLDLSGYALSLGAAPTELTSFAGTGAVSDAAHDRVFVTDGDAGGLNVLDGALAAQSGSALLSDARSIALEGNTLSVLRGACTSGGSCTGSGTVDLYDVSTGTPASSSAWTFSGTGIAASKSTLQVLAGKALVAAGDGGALVLNGGTGAVLGSIANPAGTGLDPSVVVANAVSADGDLMFISNGEAGVYVVQNDSDLSLIGAAGPVSLTMLGHLQFASLQSVNDVAYNSGYLFVAAGLGGVKVVWLNVP
jgi:hypothetical protein